MGSTYHRTPASTENCQWLNISGLANATVHGQMFSETMGNGTGSLAKASLNSAPHGLDILYSLSYKWLLPLGVCLVVIVGSIVSRLQARTPVDPSLVVPVCDYLCCCIPENIRRKFRCGVKYPGPNKKLAEDEADTMVGLVSMPKNIQE